jgi:hypothetical protein
MHISFAKKGIIIGYIAVTWGALPRYNEQQSIWESYFPFKNTNKWWRLKIAYHSKQWQTQRVKLFLFGHTKKTTKQNNKNPYHCLRQTGKIRQSKIQSFFMPQRRRVGGHINLALSVRSYVRPDIDTWFVRLSPPTVLELQL